MVGKHKNILYCPIFIYGGGNNRFIYSAGAHHTHTHTYIAIGADLVETAILVPFPIHNY